MFDKTKQKVTEPFRRLYSLITAALYIAIAAFGLAILAVTR